MSASPVLPWTFAFVGAGLLVAAIQNRSPLEEFKAALTGSTPPGKPATATQRATAGSGTSGSVADVIATGGATAGVGVGSSFVPANLVNLPAPNTGHRLTAAAAAGFAAWVKAYGKPIYITDSYRSWAQQAAAYAGDSNRFASPEGSRHVRADAVDADVNKTAPTAADRLRLQTTAAATGWRQARSLGPASCTSKGTNDEPWHYSFKVCG